jgi:hypothetical protein
MANAEMNRLIRESRPRQPGLGLIDRLRGVGALGSDRQERLNAQMAAYEDAVRHGDHIAARMADEKIESLLSEARAARQPEKQQEAVTSFDGGARGRRPIAPAGGGDRSETPAALLRRAMEASRTARSSADRVVIPVNR